eukprot:CAMPEP_0175296364 /NCGR_PEP_ID=MMETSP0093-20121207/58996_1 /TAXON_ID=311494 /ORGANISM="Alexandrium monilatum, Strain CCMP3105" /LENGTH=83 /DNA_ID=CAMNT_0016592369 /DNA_START=57 /DNA_END=305 /DNA_ORIENTATION=+
MMCRHVRIMRTSSWSRCVKCCLDSCASRGVTGGTGISRFVLPWARSTLRSQSKPETPKMQRTRGTAAALCGVIHGRLLQEVRL